MQPLLRIALSLIIFLSTSFQAGSTIAVVSDQAKLNFPTELTFYLHAQSYSPIEAVTLIYSSSGQTCLSQVARQELHFNAANSVILDWTWNLNNGRGLPPGAEVRWQWEIHDTSGATFTTQEQKMVVTDDHFKWQSVQQGAVTVLWAQGNAAFGAMLLRTALSSLDVISKKMGVDSPKQVEMVVYPNTDDVQAAALHSPDWAGGVAFPEYNSILMGIAPTETEWAAQVIPHELTHLIVHRRIANCQGAFLPTWLDEGLAVYAEGPLRSDRASGVAAALKKNSLQPLSMLTEGFSADAEIANEAYGHSGLVVAYLISTYGAEKMNALLDAVQKGATAEEALQSVYQLTTDGLDQAWRVSMGFAAVGTATPPQAATAAGVENTQIPTFALWTPIGQATAAAATLTPTPAPSATAAAQPSVTATPGALPLQKIPFASMIVAGVMLGVVVASVLIVGFLLYFFGLRKR